MPVLAEKPLANVCKRRNISDFAALEHPPEYNHQAGAFTGLRTEESQHYMSCGIEGIAATWMQAGANRTRKAISRQHSYPVG